MDRKDQPSFGRQHARVALAACVVSVLAHVVTMSLMSRAHVRMRFFPAVESLEQWADPMRLVDIIREIVSAEPAPPSGQKEVPGTGADAVREAGRLARAPEESLTEIPPLTGEAMKNLSELLPSPNAAPKPGEWEPRQEILMIEKPIVADDVAALPRRRIPRVERVSRASDVVLPVDRNALEKPVGAGGKGGVPGGLGRADVGRTVVGGAGEKPSVTGATDSPLPGEAAAMAEPKPDDIRAIEKYLKASVSVYTSFWDPKYGYFKIEIDRIGPETLPLLPKDFVFVQDSSASMSEQKLYFCRQGLTNCLTRLGPEDRFNVIGFREEAQMCFTNWVENTPDRVEKAQAFAMDMKAVGNTDIFSAVKTLLELKRTPGRPLIAFVVTDGRATAGITRSTDIIGEFSKMNEGKVSVFTMGTVQTANEYLLDLLSTCNRGESYVEKRGRWDIPASMVRTMQGMARPVLSDVKFVFPEGSPCETYPVQTSNLYLDRPLVIHGRYPKGTKNVVFQAVGLAGDAKCDMIFDLSLEKGVQQGDKDIRETWAKRKIYHLMGQYARKGDRAILKDMRDTAGSYRIDIPYEKEL